MFLKQVSKRWAVCLILLGGEDVIQIEPIECNIQPQ